MVESARNLFKWIYKIGMILITVVLAGLTILAYISATPGNGLLLISGILALLTLVTGLSISKLDDQDRKAETYRQIGEDIRKLVKVSTTYGYAEPEVHRVETATVEHAKRMAGEGAPIDDICTMIDPDHIDHDATHQEAFRKVVRAMIEN
ncbi:MAG TPA: hypothetical protein VMN38_07375 [Sphingomicrobium sp.]|nr:hypothetical protein [Sphingomicrobium sp.]